MDGAEKIVGAPEAEGLNRMADPVQTSAQQEEQIQRGAWCSCDLGGTCLGCVIQKVVREHYGQQGEAYLLTHVGTKPS